MAFVLVKIYVSLESKELTILDLFRGFRVTHTAITADGRHIAETLQRHYKDISEALQRTTAGTRHDDALRLSAKMAWTDYDDKPAVYFAL